MSCATIRTTWQKHEHLRVAVRDAFAAMATELKRWKDQIKGEVKTHDGPLQGKIVEIRHDEDFGQIIATDNRLIYFHRNSVTDGSFDDLQPRDPVELVVQTGESAIGPQASTVRRIGTMEFRSRDETEPAMSADAPAATESPATEIDVAIIGAGTAGLSARSEVAKVTDSYRVFDPRPPWHQLRAGGVHAVQGAFCNRPMTFTAGHDFEALGIVGGAGLRIDSGRVLQETTQIARRPCR